MSGRKMDRHRALAVLYYNYPTLTIETDPEWTEEMVESMTDDPKADKREVCEAHGLKYPPKKYMDWYFSNTDTILSYDDLRAIFQEAQ